MKPKKSEIRRRAPRHPPGPEAELLRAVAALLGMYYAGQMSLEELLYHTGFWALLVRAARKTAQSVRKQTQTALALPVHWKPSLDPFALDMAGEVFKKTEENARRHTTSSAALSAVASAIGIIFAWYFAKMIEAAHREAGVKEEMWVTRHDDRVRPAHAALDGVIHPAGQPMLAPDKSSNGLWCHEGDDFNCRCVAAPVQPRQQKLTSL